MSEEIRQQFEAGLAQHRAGQLGLAESHYARVVKLDPRQADAWHLLGVVAFQNGQHAKAIKRYHRALELRPGFAQAWNNLGIAQKAQDQLEQARKSFQRALSEQAQYAEAAYNLALLLEAGGELGDAERHYRDALAWRADALGTLTNLGNLLVRTRRAEEGLPMLEHVFAREPTPDHAGNLALALIELRRYEAARGLAQRAIEGAPRSSEWWGALGTAARLHGDVTAAIAPLRQAAILSPADAMLRLELSLALRAAGDEVGARIALAESRRLAPSTITLRWADALSVPVLVHDERDAKAALDRFGQGVAELSTTLEQDAARDPDGLLDAAASASSYHLHYLGHDATALQCAFGDLIGRAARAARPGLAAPLARSGAGGGSRLRVGFVSAYFSRHSVSRFFARFASGLDRTRFECFVWHTGESLDSVARAVAGAVEHFEHTAHEVTELAAAIRATNLDVLVFPDLGMDPRQQVLASWLLAPRQLALYGHPVTSGLATVDAFLSGELLEREDSDRNYRERLVRLPGLGAAPSPSDTIADGRWFDALRGARPTLLCLQNLSKLTPAFDRALVRILAGCGGRVVMFGRVAGVSARYRERLDPLLRDAGLVPEQALSIEPARAHTEFLGAIERADLVLDTPWFSGGVTSLDALAIGAPILAWEQGQARGRQTSAMLRLLELPELIATDAGGYIDSALRLLGDATERKRLGAEIRARRQRLFEADATLAAFQEEIEAQGRAAR